MRSKFKKMTNFDASKFEKIKDWKYHLRHRNTGLDLQSDFFNEIFHAASAARLQWSFLLPWN